MGETVTNDEVHECEESLDIKPNAKCVIFSVSHARYELWRKVFVEEYYNKLGKNRNYKVDWNIKTDDENKPVQEICQISDCES